MSEERTGYEVAVLAETYDLDAALARWNYYQQLQRKVLTSEDYATIQGKKALKRSGFSKLRIVTGAASEVLEEQRIEQDGIVRYRFTVKVVTPDGRSEVGDGICDSAEMKGGNIKATEHNIRAKALTRAKNRATADLIGGGIVSAEELDDDEPQSKPHAVRGKPRRVEPPQEEPKPEPTKGNGEGEYANDWVGNDNRRAAFWAKTADMALNHNDVHEACGVETMKRFAGTFDEAIAACNAWLGAKLEEDAVDRAEQEGMPY